MMTAVQPSTVSHLTQADSVDTTVPSSAFLTFPPFPACPPSAKLIPFARWKASGVWLKTLTTDGEVRDESRLMDHGTQPNAHRGLSHDAHGTPLTPTEMAPVEEDLEAKLARAKVKRSRRLANSKLAVRVEKEDCWKIGEEGVDWEEPDGTSRSSYHP